MLVFPNAKINIGLNIISQRNDGYHNLETLFYPIGLKDALEFVENNSNRANLTLSGIKMDSETQDNIILRAYHLLAKEISLPGLDIHLHKAIPYGSGLGGGSADAAFFLMSLNNYFELKLTSENLKLFALKLGADCSFFIENKPALASGIGDILELKEINLKGYFLLLIKPSFGVNTKTAYSNIIPAGSGNSLSEYLEKPPEKWMGLIKNDFESSVFKCYPELSLIKNHLLANGAVYASMSGSGSAVYGFFKSEPDPTIMSPFQNYFFWKEML